MMLLDPPHNQRRLNAFESSANDNPGSRACMSPEFEQQLPYLSARKPVLHK